MSALLIATLACFLLVLVHAMLLQGWRARIVEAVASAADVRPEADRQGTFVSMVVPARDAEDTIVALLQDLHAQQWPKENSEVLVVDDHSTDATAARVQGMMKHWPQLRLLDMPEGIGKKAAIARGVMEARGEVVLLTDADARCGPMRVARMVSHWSATGDDLMLMPVRTCGGTGSLAGLQREEQTALSAAAAGSGLEGVPLLANGANMAFTRKAFFEVGGYGGDRWASGDDMFLLRRMKRNGRKVGYLLHPEVLVTVQPVVGLRAFLSQRIRWSGKMRAYQDLAAQLAGLASFLLPWVLVWLTVAVMNGVRIGDAFVFHWSMLLAAWALWAVPVLQLVAAMRRFQWVAALRPEGTHGPVAGFLAWWPTLLAMVAFSIYAPIIAILSIFVRPTWKGRRI